MENVIKIPHKCHNIFLSICYAFKSPVGTPTNITSVHALRNSEKEREKKRNR